MQTTQWQNWSTKKQHPQSGWLLDNMGHRRYYSPACKQVENDKVGEGIHSHSPWIGDATTTQTPEQLQGSSQIIGALIFWTDPSRSKETSPNLTLFNQNHKRKGVRGETMERSIVPWLFFGELCRICIKWERERENKT